MSGPRQIRNLALLGFMGAGKSSTGRLVAERLGFGFVDTDARIEARVGASITEVFECEGEARFREYEREVVAELASLANLVIATGGGLPTRQANLDSLKTHALTFYLWAPPEKLWERVRQQRHRPLLAVPDPQARIRELLAARDPFYRQADVLINTAWRQNYEVAHQVVMQFRMAREEQAGG